ncbi:SPFH domain-containing protein [Anaerolineales bacterium HSG25]|nr:SPFH domain-containing protein [Anaerolineales bacterium HSG25]
MKEQLKSALKQVAKDALESDEFSIDPRDFISAKDIVAATSGTQIDQVVGTLTAAAEMLNSSVTKQDDRGKVTNIVSPVVMPNDSRSYGWLVSSLFFGGIGAFGSLVWLTFPAPLSIWASYLFGPHFWLVWLLFTVFNAWRSTFVEIPDGCQALITRRGAVVEIVGAGRKWFSPLDPFKKVSYIVNVTKEYPYNAPIRKAPTQGRVNASVDLFLQFKIEDPQEFIFTLGGARGFSEKLDNAISEMTRALIYEQRADAIYDLVGESTQPMLDSLNRQFLPAVKFVSANITHAEPSDRQYRMDLAAEEIIKVAKEAYTYEYELNLRKELDEGELNKELGSLEEMLSKIEAEIAKHQAKIDTADEKATNRANAYTRKLLIEAESEANANAALLQAQALDIKALNMSRYPEILDYRYQEQVLEQIQGIADKLPQIINIGPADQNQVDFMGVAKNMMGLDDSSLFEEGEREAIQKKSTEIVARIKERAVEIDDLLSQESI